MDEDITDDWETIKGLPFGKALTDDVDLSGEMVVGAHPEFVYRVVEGTYGLRYMSIWRLKCFGQKRRGRPVYHKTLDCWIVQYDVPLWKAELAPDTVAQHAERKFLMPKKDSYTTLADVTAAFVMARDKALDRYREQIREWHGSIARLQGEIDTTSDVIQRMNGFVPDFGK